MRIAFTKGAGRQLDAILDYIALRNPQGAKHVQVRIQDILGLLARHPFAGPSTEYKDGRRIAFRPSPT